MPTVMPEPASRYPDPYNRPPAARSASPAMWAHLGALLTWLGGLIVFAPLSLFCFVTPLIIRGPATKTGSSVITPPRRSTLR